MGSKDLLQGILDEFKDKSVAGVMREIGSAWDIDGGQLSNVEIVNEFFKRHEAQGCRFRKGAQGRMIDAVQGLELQEALRVILAQTDDDEIYCPHDGIYREEYAHLAPTA